MSEDIWARWLSFRRQGSSTLSPELLQQLYAIRDRVLDLASIQPGQTVLDVGCGDGLIGFGALERVGAHGYVVFSDISRELIDRCRDTAESLDVLNRCRFLVNSADDLHEVGTESVDVVTTRSVLIYVRPKQRAVEEFYRVLRRPGRAVIAEPINRYSHPEPRGTFIGYDVSPVPEIAAKLVALYERVETERITPMLDFDERDLVMMAEQARFREVHLDLSIDVKATPRAVWDEFIKRSGNPLSPTLEEAMNEALAPAERDRLVSYLRPLVERGEGISRRAFAFMSAVK